VIDKLRTDNCVHTLPLSPSVALLGLSPHPVDLRYCGSGSEGEMLPFRWLEHCHTPLESRGCLPWESRAGRSCSPWESIWAVLSLGGTGVSGGGSWGRSSRGWSCCVWSPSGWSGSGWPHICPRARSGCETWSRRCTRPAGPRLYLRMPTAWSRGWPHSAVAVDGV